jgi:hypothetical protein
MSIITLLDDLLVLTHKSLSLAQEESWDALIENETIRQTTVVEIEPLLDQLDSVSDEARTKLEELTQLNELLSNVCSARRNELAGNIKQLSTGRQASKAYTE